MSLYSCVTAKSLKHFEFLWAFLIFGTKTKTGDNIIKWNIFTVLFYSITKFNFLK